MVRRKFGLLWKNCVMSTGSSWSARHLVLTLVGLRRGFTHTLEPGNDGVVVVNTQSVSRNLERRIQVQV